jgi:monoamine oxidase
VSNSTLAEWLGLEAMKAPGVIVVGPGAAGLAADLCLTKQGHAVTVPEASDRVGGRVLTVTLAIGDA